MGRIPYLSGINPVVGGNQFSFIEPGTWFMSHRGCNLARMCLSCTPHLQLSDTIVPQAFPYAKRASALAPCLFPGMHLACDCLLNMDHLAVGIQGAMHPNFLAFVLLHFVLVIDIVSGVARGILKHVLVP